jgi:hypothetical protein
MSIMESLNSQGLEGAQNRRPLTIGERIGFPSRLPISQVFTHAHGRSKVPNVNIASVTIFSSFGEFHNGIQ